jgi:hypothetical protein
MRSSGRSVLLVALVLLIACAKPEEPVYSMIGKARARRSTSVVLGHVKILVLGDAFGTDNEWAFNNVVSRVEGATDTIEQLSSGVSVDVEKLLIPTNPGVSKLGLRFNNQRTDCWFTRPPNYGKLIAAESKGKTADYVIVVFYGPDKGGCSDDDAITISRDTSQVEIEHELGHSLATLYDEGCHDGDQMMYPATPCIGDHNCSSDKQHLAWPTNGVAEPYHQGCNGYCNGIYAPTPDCLMNNAGAEFCQVCQAVVHDAVRYYAGIGTTLQASSCFKKTLTLQPVSTSFVRAHIRIAGGVVTVSDVSSGYGSRRPDLVASNGLVAITVNDQVRAVAPLNERPFFARSFAMTNGTFDETVVPTGTVDFTVDIPGLTIDELQKDGVNIKARLLSTGIGRAIGVTSLELAKSTQDLKGEEFALGNDFKTYLLNH